MEESNWKQVQTKTFTKWLNTQLKNPIQNIFTDLHDGIALVNLMDKLSQAKIVHNNPAITRFQKIENVQNVLTFLQESNIKLINIGSTDIVDGNEKLILGLIWTIIKRFVIQKHHATNDSLLRWCKAVTAGYNVDIKDFGRSWQDGMAFNAIIHRFRPDLINYMDLRRSEKMKNLENAFDVAEKELGIPKLIDPEDIVMVVNPDEKSIMTYVSQYHDKFGNSKEKEGKKRIDDFLEVYDNIKRMEHNLNKEKTEYQKMVDEMENNNKKGKGLINELKELYEKNVRLESGLVLRKIYLSSLLGNINTFNNFYKSKSTEDDKFLRASISNEIKLCDKCFNVIDKPVVNSENLKNLCELLLSSQRVEDQLTVLNEVNKEIKDTKIKTIIDEKIDFFENLIIKKDSKRLKHEAMEIFRQMNKNNGIIQKSVAVEILSILGIYETENLNYNFKAEYNFDEFMNLVSHFYDNSFDIIKLKRDFALFSDDGKHLNLNHFNTKLNSVNDIVIDKQGGEKLDIDRLFDRFTISQ